MKGHKVNYSADEMRWLEDNRLMMIADYHRAFRAKFRRDDVSEKNLHSLRKRKGWKTGRTGQFVKGCVPLNKGTKCPAGKGGNHPNAQLHQFRKGRVPHNYHGAGHERIDSKDGYVILIVAERNPHTGAATRPVLKHKYLWEKQNGPLPRGHVLKCLNGDKTNCDPSNWEAIPRAILPSLGARAKLPYASAEPEVKPVLLTLAKLKHAAGAAGKERGRQGR